MTHASVVDVLAGKYSVGTTLTVKGWIRTRRDSKAGISFLAVSDGSCFHPVQAVAPNTLANYENEVQRLTTACSVEVTGTVVESQGSGQAFELQATEVKVVGWVEDPDTYPMSAKRHSIEYLREQGHLRARTNIVGAVTRVRNCLSQAIHRFFHEQGYLWIAAPLITASDTEGAGEMFRVSTLDMENLPRTPEGKVDYDKDFFGKETFLTVSGQLNVETYACALSKVYTFGPTFRAENSNTSRHLAEFWMIEPEVAFADLEDNMVLAEAMIKYIIQYVLDHAPEEMEFFNSFVDKGLLERIQVILGNEFGRVTYTEAVELLIQSGKEFQFPVSWGMDLQTEHERYLTEEIFKKPVFVTDYPKDIKAFYMRLNDDGRTVAACDLLVPGVGEIIGGSQREERLEVLRERMDQMGLDEKDYWWYLDLRKYGGVKHAGYGLGFERILMYITGMSNIRDVLPFPRTPNSAEF